MAAMREKRSEPTIAIFPWGDVIEEFLDPIGLTVEDFVKRMSGGWLFGYVSALQHAGWRPVIVFGSESSNTATRLVHSGTGAPVWLVPSARLADARRPIEYTSIYSLRRWLATPLRMFCNVIEREQCRAIMIQEYEYTRFDALVRLATRSGIRAFATFQGGDRTLSWIEGLVRGRSLKKCAGLVIASEGERLRVERRYAGRHPPIADIPNPIDTEEWRATDRQKARSVLGLQQKAFIAVNHGRIDIGRKGLDVLLEAWAASGGDELVVIGSGQDHDAFAALLAGNSSGKIRWISDYTTDRAFVRQWLSAADVYVTASRVEGMPVAPIEAMACGLPIVATDAQGLPDILKDGEASGGLLVPRNDVAAITAAIERLRHDADLRRRLSRAARRRVEKAFSIAAVGAELGEFLNRASSGDDRSSLARCQTQETGKHF
jgi:glycosyltransferase involved in cell wall biosynthesis